ncbi:hypothetical protein SDC9_189089 [bioreactor metagenome]|uniref:Uncharacterized protein n=1 Tax=bioreactor metagenome TaxID=1076179 RepID=A0A645HRF3_9ZZZZ
MADIAYESCFEPVALLGLFLGRNQVLDHVGSAHGKSKLMGNHLQQQQAVPVVGIRVRVAEHYYAAKGFAFGDHGYSCPTFGNLWRKLQVVQPCKCYQLFLSKDHGATVPGNETSH